MCWLYNSIATLKTLNISNSYYIATNRSPTWQLATYNAKINFNFRMSAVVKSSVYSPLIVDNDHDTICPYTIAIRKTSTDSYDEIKNYNIHKNYTQLGCKYINVRTDDVAMQFMIYTEYQQLTHAQIIQCCVCG